MVLEDWLVSKFEKLLSDSEKPLNEGQPNSDPLRKAFLKYQQTRKAMFADLQNIKKEADILGKASDSQVWGFCNKAKVATEEATRDLESRTFDNLDVSVDRVFRSL